MVTDVNGPIAHALLKLLIKRVDPVSGVTVITDVIVLEHQR